MRYFKTKNFQAHIEACAYVDLQSLRKSVPTNRVKRSKSPLLTVPLLYQVTHKPPWLKSGQPINTWQTNWIMQTSRTKTHITNNNNITYTYIQPKSITYKKLDHTYSKNGQYTCSKMVQEKGGEGGREEGGEAPRTHGTQSSNWKKSWTNQDK